MPFDIAFDLCFVEPHGGRKVSDAPDAVLFQIDLSDEFELCTQVFAAGAFQLPDGICHGNVRRYFNLEVYVVFIGVEAFDPERRIFLHRGIEDFLEFGEHVGFEELPSVLSAPDDVVLVLVCRVVEVLNPHETSVSPKRETCKVPFIPGRDTAYTVSGTADAPGVSW